MLVSERDKIEVDVLVKEYADSLNVCTCCGAQPRIAYEYLPNYSCEPGKKHPHLLHVECPPSMGDCKCGATEKIAAEDDEADVREALRILVLMWNSLPGESNDSAIDDLYKEQYYSFNSQEEAKEYFEGRGESYDENAVYLGVHYEPKGE